MKQLALLIFLSILCFSLASTVLADTCAQPTNICDNNYAARATKVTQQLQAFYTQQSNYLQNDPGSVPSRYEAAFFYFGEGPGGATVANQLLAQQFKTTPALSPHDALYLAWSYVEFKESFTPANLQIAEANLSRDNYGSSLTTNESDFLTATAYYIFNLANGTATPQQEAALGRRLRTYGDAGWDAETNPTALANVVVGLAALRNETSNATLRLLAEMNLDIIFSRFAALDAGGIFAGPLTGATIASNLYNPALSPWYGWSYLLFGTNTPASTEPGLVYTGYCANNATRAVYDVHANQPYTLEVREPLGGGDSDTIVYNDFILGGTDDVTSNFTSNYTVRATVRFTDDPTSFILFTTATSNSSVANGPDAIDNARLFTDANRSLIIGRLGGSVCREPHLFLGSGFEWSTGASGVTIIHQIATDEYFALRFIGGQTNVSIDDRYAPLAGQIPALYDGDRGTIIFPLNASAGGIFSFERIPHLPSSIQDGDLGSLETWAAANTSLVTSDGNIMYASNLSGTPVQYTYNPGESLLLDNNVWSLTNPPTFGVRKVMVAGSEAEEDSVSKPTNGNWTVTGELGGYGYVMTLNFSGPGKQASPGTYGCTATSSSTVTPSFASNEERLGFLAATLVQGRSGAYVLACGDPADVFDPVSAAQLDPSIVKACVLSIGADRTVGIIYDSSAGTGLPGVIGDINTFFPFNGGATSISATICAAIANSNPSTLDFAQCGSSIGLGSLSPSYQSLYLFLSPNAHALIISSNADPAAQGVFATVWGFLRSLFGGTTTIPSVSPSTTAPLAKAYIFTDGKGKAVHALVTPTGETDALYFNFNTSVEPLITGISTATYLAGGADGHTQFINITNDALWPQLTSQLRVTSGGTPATFTAICGDNKIEYGEECDNGTTPNAVVEHCPTNPNFNVTCDDQCQLNFTQCSLCVDNDHDGYYAPGCPFVPPSQWDCDDNNPNVNPNATENCNNGIDDNCNGCVDSQVDGCTNGPVCGGPASEPFNCSESVCPNGYVCNVTVTPPPSSGGSCPTAWQDVATQGDYQFSTRIDSTGWPELRITRLNPSYQSFSCTLNSAANQELVAGWGGSIAVDYNSSTIHAASIILSSQGSQWILLYGNNTVDAERLQTCWNVTGWTLARSTLTTPPTLFLTFSIPAFQNICSMAKCTLSPDNCTTGSTCTAVDPNDKLLQCIANGGGGGGCFTPDTMIMTPEGPHPIGSLRVGDIVISYDTTTGTRLTSKITGTEQVPADEVLVINGRVRTTDVHPFFTQRGWVEGGQLVIGDEIFTASGSYERVASLIHQPYYGLVYNIHVESSAHNFFADGLLAHNKMQQLLPVEED